METQSLEEIREMPGFSTMLKAVLKSQIQYLVDQLAKETQEESMFVTASLVNGSLDCLGSQLGREFFEDDEDIKTRFLGFCSKRMYQKSAERDHFMLVEQSTGTTSDHDTKHTISPQPVDQQHVSQCMPPPRHNYILSDQRHRSRQWLNNAQKDLTVKRKVTSSQRHKRDQVTKMHAGQENEVFSTLSAQNQSAEPDELNLYSETGVENEGPEVLTIKSEPMNEDFYVTTESSRTPKSFEGNESEARYQKSIHASLTRATSSSASLNDTEAVSVPGPSVNTCYNLCELNPSLNSSVCSKGFSNSISLTSSPVVALTEPYVIKKEFSDPEDTDQCVDTNLDTTLDLECEDIDSDQTFTENDEMEASSFEMQLRNVDGTDIEQLRNEIIDGQHSKTASNSMTETRRKRVVLTLEQKIQVIKQLERGIPARRLAKELRVGKTQIQSLRKKKQELMSDFYENKLPGRTKRRPFINGNEGTNELTLEWLQDAVARGISITGPLIQKKALEFASQLGNTGFKASNGWLENFKQRNNLYDFSDSSMAESCRQPRIRKCLTIEERVKCLKLHKSGKSSREVANELGVGKTQVLNVLKRKHEILDDYESKGSLHYKRRQRELEYGDVNSIMYRWYMDHSSRIRDISKKMLQERAREVAKGLGHDGFSGSIGWVLAFLKRSKIVLKTNSDESEKVNFNSASHWKDSISDICKGYSPENIFSMKESGLLFCDTAKATILNGNETCSDGEQSKHRVTVALCASVTGEKLKPLVIGSIQTADAFGQIPIKELPVRYKANRKAWMLTPLMVDWLEELDWKMHGQNREIILLLDKSPVHPDIELQNIKLQFLPSDTTTVLQPMDAGIIQSFKMKYRKRQLQYGVDQTDKHPSKPGPEILRGITVLEAINWISAAWQEIEKDTIAKCFAKCGFTNGNITVPLTSDCDIGSSGSVNDSVSDTVSKIEEECPEEFLSISHELFDCDFHELSSIDDKLFTCDNRMIDWDRPALEILNELNKIEQDSSCDAEDDTTHQPALSCDR